MVQKMLSSEWKERKARNHLGNFKGHLKELLKTSPNHSTGKTAVRQTRKPKCMEDQMVLRLLMQNSPSGQGLTIQLNGHNIVWPLKLTFNLKNILDRDGFINLQSNGRTGLIELNPTGEQHISSVPSKCSFMQEIGLKRLHHMHSIRTSPNFKNCIFLGQGCTVSMPRYSGTIKHQNRLCLIGHWLCKSKITLKGEHSISLVKLFRRP